MSYSRAAFDEAMRELERRRTGAAAAAAQLQQRMLAQSPRLREIQKALSDTGAKLSKAIFSGGDLDAAIETVKAENQQLQQEMAAILSAAGERAVNFDPQPVCPLCGDTGYREGKMCRCLEQLLREKSTQQIFRGLGGAPARFEDLDLSFYDDKTPPGRGLSPRQRMEQVFAYCRSYAEQFDLSMPSLLLRGPTGTGKTHVSLAIAAAVAGTGHQVLYQPAGSLFGQLEKEHFGRVEGNTEEIAASCDLLVLDDLGTEFETSFCTASLYTILNTRLLDHLPTVISTNLTQEGLQQRYGDQITSRITGAFETLLFVGKDIRQQRRQREMSRC